MDKNKTPQSSEIVEQTSFFIENLQAASEKSEIINNWARTVSRFNEKACCAANSENDMVYLHDTVMAMAYSASESILHDASDEEKAAYQAEIFNDKLGKASGYTAHVQVMDEKFFVVIRTAQGQLFRKYPCSVE